ncbi:LacI family transcriptional regulator [Actinotalea ferrariae CF5-4]|uniref:LacI family transcriptional regulator n=1 Tax=Actinotalea ferrariae CF5-4 TaxID=948458 RepID=A0A021VUC3_9CELL|nr:LacI family DNA-binding transcriptional regulator [Actinotalea ferrariae]EYR62672.1 LacI family transcriptional regulator [Actinotalea ferrariae CF5-4]
MPEDTLPPVGPGDAPAAVTPPGPALAPTLEDVAARAGVSRSTASRAINGGLKVSPDAQAAVDAAVVALRYTPNRAARSLVTRRTDAVALVVPEPDQLVLTDPYFAATVQGLSAALEPTDIQLVLLIARRGGDDGRTTRYLRNRNVDGAVVVSHHRDDAIVPLLADAGLPCVFVGRPFGAADGLTFVDVDNRDGGRRATEHLLAAGCRRIGTVAGPADMAAGLDRLEGWKDALRAAGLPPVAAEHGDFTAAGGAEATERLLREHPDLDGLFVASDLMATGALRVLQRRGRAVPEDVRLVGFDDLGVAESAEPALTTVASPVVRMSQVAGELLLCRIGALPRHREPQERLFGTRLVVRESA